jgi:hypothetical protein
MKTSWGKPVHVISFIRTLLIVLAVAVGTVAAEDLETVRKKAKAGDATAQNRLGVIYSSGQGVPKNDAEAVKWLNEAAEQGHAKAQYELGYMYAWGKGVPEDNVAAYAWYSLAAASGDEEDREGRDRFKDDLTPSQLDRGQVMAREIFERIEKRKAAEGQ